MSIKPEFVARILSGEKRVEFRKQPFREAISHVLIYSTTPVGAIVGICEVEGIVVGSPQTVWRKYATVAGIARARFAEYFNDCEQAVAIRITNAIQFAEPLPLSAVGERRPPQSFRYLRCVSVSALLSTVC